MSNDNDLKFVEPCFGNNNTVAWSSHCTLWSMTLDPWFSDDTALSSRDREIMALCKMSINIAVSRIV